jgi:hypothetical protein
MLPFSRMELKWVQFQQLKAVQRGATGDVEGRSSKSTKAKGKFVLACQPYMGGVARIKRATHGFPSSFQASIKF